MSEIYLAGPIQHAEDGGHGWRDRVKEEFDHPDIEWSDPLDKYDGPAEGVVIHNGDPPEDVAPDADLVSVSELVESDKEMVARADGVLVGWDDVPSAGTPMEVMFAHANWKPVAIWYRGEAGISPWMEYHSTSVADDLSEAVDNIVEAIEIEQKVAGKVGGGIDAR